MQVPVRLRNMNRHNQTILAATNTVAQLLKLLCTKHAPKSVWRINRTINEHMGHVDALLCPLCVQCLAEQSPPTHSRSMGVLPGVAPHGCSGRGHKYGATTTLLHQRAHALGNSKQGEHCHSPAKLELLETGFLKSLVPYLRPKIEDEHMNGATLCLYAINKFLYAVGFCGIHHHTRGRTMSTSGLDVSYQLLQPVLVTSSYKHCVVTLLCESGSSMTTDSCPCS
mmetsp:Transcript_11822/g.21556  ORF Transcript_11822/g.21556 Transcript_11822/m.21556 type:complete len:225 (+) Transcript_11822:79-753(+)